MISGNDETERSKVEVVLTAVITSGILSVVSLGGGQPVLGGCGQSSGL